MDTETAEALQALTRMIDNVNERNSLGRLALSGVMVLLASARRQGMLNDSELSMIEETFREIADDPALQRYERVDALFERARDLWAAAEPK